MSRPDRPQVAVDFAAPKKPGRTRPIAALVLMILTLAVVGVAVTQLLLR